MNHDSKEKKLTRWLLIATIVLLALVLGLQLWQLFGRKNHAYSTAADAGSGNPAGLSAGKAAIIEDIQTLNPDLPFDRLAALSSEELEQLWKTGAPGLPVGVSAAALAAEEYAGTVEIDSVTSETDPELNESPAHYDVELHHPTMGDFAYKIDAYTGEVLEGTPDILRSLQAANATVPDASTAEQPPAAGQAPASAAQDPAAKPQTPAPDAPPAQAPASGEEDAKAAAFAHAGVTAAGASSVRCKLDRDDGRQVYEVEFWVGDTEYDYKIDAATGAVLEAKQEVNGRGGSSAQQSGGFIGEEAAKNAAFAHAGVSAADAGRVEWELEEDDGRWVYEVEFRVGAVEYAYEISAGDGAVLKAEQDT